WSELSTAATELKQWVAQELLASPLDTGPGATVRAATAVLVIQNQATNNTAAALTQLIPHASDEALETVLAELDRNVVLGAALDALLTKPLDPDGIGAWHAFQHLAGVPAELHHSCTDVAHYLTGHQFVADLVKTEHGLVHHALTHLVPLPGGV